MAVMFVFNRFFASRKKEAARLVAEAERLAREVEDLRLENLELRESLTFDLALGMANLRAFEDDHHQVYARWIRSGESYVVVQIRVDRGEDGSRFMDPAGTDTLRVVARTIRQAVRSSDRAYVAGDGEFLVLLHGATVQGGVIAGERFRSRVEELAIADPADPERHLTVTVAASEVGFRHSDEKDLLIELDELMLGAGGTNLVVWPH